MCHAGVTRAADEILLHDMAFMGCRVVHSWVPGAPVLPIPSGSSQGFVTRCLLLSVQCFALPDVHFPRGAASALPCPCIAGPSSPHLPWAGHTHLEHKPRQKNPKHSMEKILLLSLFLGLKFKNIHTSQFCLNWLCHCHSSLKLQLNVALVSAGGRNSVCPEGASWLSPCSQVLLTEDAFLCLFCLWAWLI